MISMVKYYDNTTTRHTTPSIPRHIGKLKLDISNNKLHRISAIITGGDTTGAHAVSWEDGDTLCDCIGFTSHGHCRHEKFILNTYEAMYEVLMAWEFDNT